jgi:hypothetical protein
MHKKETDIITARGSLSRTALRLWPITLLFAMLPVIAGCNFVIPPLESGVRVVTEEVDAQMQSIIVPISNAADFGVIIATFGGSGAQQFSGFTNSDGYDDHPTANADAEWQFVAQFEQSSAPDCPDLGPSVHNGTPQGVLTEVIQCLVQ